MKILDPAAAWSSFHFCIDFTLKQSFQSMLPQFFLLQLSKWKFSPRVSERAQNLWIVEAKNFARVTFCFDKVTSSDRCAPHLLSLGITLVMGVLRYCLFFFAHSLPNHPGPATVVCYQLLSNQARHKDLDSWWWWGWWWHWSWWYFIGPCPVKYHPADIAYCIIAGQCYIDPSQGSKGSFSVQCGSARAYLIRLGKSHHVPAVHLIIFPYTATNLKNPHQNFLRNESINRSNFFSLRDTAVSSVNIRITKNITFHRSACIPILNQTHIHPFSISHRGFALSPKACI